MNALREKGLAVAVATAMLLCMMTPAMAERQTRRTEEICKTPLATRQALANQGDPDGVFCLATLYAYRYGDERYPDSERLGYRDKAIPLIERAESLGYDVDDLDRHIVGGDNVTTTGNYFGRQPSSPSYAPQPSYAPPPQYYTPPPSVSGTLQPSYNCTSGGASQGNGMMICH